MPSARQTIAAGTMAAALSIGTPLVMSNEGRSLVAYLDPVAIPTICDGETAGVHLGDRATAKQCDDDTRQGLRALYTRIQAPLPEKLTPNQLAAFGSFAWNIGYGAFSNSTTHMFLMNGHAEDACRQMALFNCIRTAPGAGESDPGKPCYRQAADHKVSAGLSLRRRREIKVCLDGQ